MRKHHGGSSSIAEGLLPVVVVWGVDLKELERMKALEHFPSPAVLMDRLGGRNVDFYLLIGVCSACFCAGVAGRIREVQ